MLLKWVIPDIPKKLQDQIRRENYLTNEIIIKHEMLKARGISAGGDSTAWDPASGDKEIELVRCPTNNSTPSTMRRRITGNEFGDSDTGKHDEVMV